MQVELGLVGAFFLLMEYLMVVEVKCIVGEGGEVLRFCLLGNVHSFLFQFLQSLLLELVLLAFPLGPVTPF